MSDLGCKDAGASSGASAVAGPDPETRTASVKAGRADRVDSRYLLQGESF